MLCIRRPSSLTIAAEWVTTIFLTRPEHTHQLTRQQARVMLKSTQAQRLHYGSRQAQPLSGVLRTR
jgi:hypothetical protein